MKLQAYPLIYVFAEIAAAGLLAVGLSKDPPEKKGNETSLKDLISVRKLATYVFLIFTLLTFLQINTDYNTTAADVSLATVLVDSMALIVAARLWFDVVTIFKFLVETINKSR
jgi:hypothetical protein